MGLDLETLSRLAPVYAPYVAGALLVLGVLAYALRRRRKDQRGKLALEQARTDEVYQPPSLHPVINPDICIGSLSCITACPEGDILGVVDGVAKLIVGANCIGHGRCAIECPVHAISLVVGTAERGVDLPEVDTHFESSRKGVYVVGELGGMGLIKNAITQGLQCASHLGTQLGGGGGGEVLIVGAGPAGLATAVGLRAANVDFRIVDQATFGGTIAQYPRQKVVMTERVTLPIVGKFGKATISKEELLETWDSIARRARFTVEEMVKVEQISGDDGAFTVSTNRGEIAASKVVLATGRRGSPRKLGCAGEDLPKVTYALDDPAQYRGKRVLIVGGGDSAIEAACSLAEVGEIEVAISYRQKSFTKCRQANRERITRAIEAGEIHAFFGSTVKEVAEGSATITLEDKRAMRLQNDFVIACLGGELPAAFLKSAGVGMKRHTGVESIEIPLLDKKPVKRAAGKAARATPGKQRKRDYLGATLILVGAAVIGALSMAGWEYYVLDLPGRKHSEVHELFRSSGPIGHGIGVIATLFMMSNFLYPLRKRLEFMKGSAPIKSWLTFHVFVGIMSPIVIAFHAAFQSRNQLATATYVSLIVVVGTGIIGRFIFGLVPSGKAGNEELELVRSQLELEREKVRDLLEDSHVAERLRAMFEKLSAEPARGGSLLLHLFGGPFRFLADRVRLARVRWLFEDREAYLGFRYAYLDMRRLHTQVSFYAKLKRLLSGWRLFHVVLSVFLVVIIAFHVGFSLYLGYKWIF